MVRGRAAAKPQVYSPRPRRRRRGLRLFLWLLAGLLVVLIGAGAGGYFYLRKGLPVVEGQLQVAGLKEPVTVLRDRWGVPHIYAGNRHDLFFAQGYVTAQDRLFQMDISRRAAAGRLAEIFGKDLIETDKFLRSFGLHRGAQAMLTAMSPMAREAAEAYAAGVTAYIEDAIRAGNLPPEFRLVGYAPEPWELVHTAGIAKLMAYDLSGNWSAEVWYLQAAQKLGLEKVSQLMPEYPESGPVIMHYGAGLPLEGLLAAARPKDEWAGSNNWVLAGSRTATGKPLLANDPHLGMGAPAIWYQSHLVIPGEMNVTGVTFPGVPGVVIGHNDHIAWGVTNLGPDTQDLYLEVPNPANPREFLYNGRWEPATVIIEEIKVKGEDAPVRHEVLITRHGPIITPVAGSKENRPAAALALRWTAHDPSSELDAFLRVNTAKDWPEFRAALRHFTTPTQNFVFAAADGTIAYRGNGRIPIRKQGNGLFPAPGWNSDYEWEGFIPWEKLPETVNPADGFIATANARVVDDAYPYFLSSSWAPPYRTARIQEVLQGASQWTVKEMQALQNDVANLQARTLWPVLEPALAEGFRQLGGMTEREQAALAALRGWDQQDTAKSVGASIWHTWYWQMAGATFRDELGEDLYKRMPNTTLVFDRLIQEAATGPGSGWFDNINTLDTEGLATIAATSFREAVKELEKQLGKKVEKWEWGSLHQLPYKHQLGAVAALRPVFNVSAQPVAGSGVTVNANSFKKAKELDFTVTNGPVWRQVVDLADLPGNSWDVLGPGQSGHPVSNHYDDQYRLWREGQYHPQLFTEPALAGARQLILRP